MKRLIPNLLTILIISLLISILVFFLQNLGDSNFFINLLKELGYFGPYVFSTLASLSLAFIPVPTFTPFFLELGLDRYVILIAFVLGELTGGAILIFLFSQFRVWLTKRTKKLEQFAKSVHEKFPKSPYLVALLWFTFAPNEPMLITMVLLRYKIIYILGLVMIGTIVYNILLGSISIISVDLIGQLIK